ncbi:PREDICTED: uncharacterized protein LOC109129980 [Camelina sativa]|uniref:Uncharacterized protein LOC109129980 n=1 Tax=Camelina sativa TaxID=90675 RepID=A0ABM1R6F8_CAMSA|nr:PREDICTED: uncharacterized protein LOC109129980 [Camelina sativa]
MSIKNVVLLLVIISVVVSTNAQLPQLPFPFPFQPSPGMPGFPDIAKYWSSVMNIPGCITEISQAILSGRFGNISPACCKAFLEVESNCLPKLPLKPFFPPMLKEQCSRIAGAIPPATK